MATNPMQRKARNSFLLGMLLMLLILGVVIGFLIFQLMNSEQEKQELQSKTVYVASKDISSGDTVTLSDLTAVKVSSAAAPTNAVTASSFTDAETGLDLDNVIAKINLNKGTVVSTDMLYLDGEEATDDVRRQEYNTIILPMNLQTGDYIDVRLLLPSGQDYIVVSKKKVEIPQIGGVDATDTVWVELSEGETLMMSNAIVEAYMINGSKLYATIYTEAGNQEAAATTYPVNGEVGKLIESDPNIVDEAKNAIRARYNQDLRENYINRAISGQEDATGNVESGMQESITNSQTSREEYLQSLSGATTVTE